jgi:hypothetical protein
MKKKIDKLAQMITDMSNDMTIIYAPDFVGEEARLEFDKRVKDCGKGGLGYLSDQYVSIMKLLEEIKNLI